MKFIIAALNEGKKRATGKENEEKKERKKSIDKVSIRIYSLESGCKSSYFFWQTKLYDWKWTLRLLILASLLPLGNLARFQHELYEAKNLYDFQHWKIFRWYWSLIDENLLLKGINIEAGELFSFRRVIVALENSRELSLEVFAFALRRE